MSDAELPLEAPSAPPAPAPPAFVAICDRCGEKIAGDSDADAHDRLDYHRGGHMMLFRDLDDLMDRFGALEHRVHTLQEQLQHQLNGTEP